MAVSVESCNPTQESHAAKAAPRNIAAIAVNRGWYLPVKLAVEWVMALVLLIATAPVCIFLAVLVKLTSSGPVFYAQTRLGLNARIFRMYKFRTMVNNAEGRTGAVWAAKNDCRITSVGKFLRMTHLDEVPQLWNVLRGEMSLIGPRPERPELAVRISRQIPEFRQRLALRPGITGLAQLLLPADDPNDAGMNCVRRKLAHDIRYIRELGWVMDLRICLGTPCYFAAAAIQAIQQKLVRPYAVSEAEEYTESDLENPANQNAVTADAAR